MLKDSTLTVFRSATKFFSGTLLSRISGMLRDMSIAYAFGTEGTLAIFFIAFRFSHLARRLFGEGSLQTAFIPCFEEIRLKEKGQEHFFFRDLNVLLFIILSCFIAVSIGVLTATSHLFTLSSDNLQLCKLTALMMPSLLFICLYGLNTAYLECEKSYFTPSVAPVAFNGVWIAAALYFSKSDISQAMIGLSLAVVLGCFAQWLFTFPKVYSSLRLQNFQFFQNCSPFSDKIRIFAKPLLFANIGVAASQINNALDPLFARFANPEGPAWLWYAIRLQQLPLSLFGIALAGALLPPLSRAAKSKDEASFNNLLDYAISKTAQFMIPISFASLTLGLSAITLIYGRGQFQAESIAGTARCLWGYSLGLLPMSLILIQAPSFYARSDYKTPLRASLISIGINFLQNAFFIFYFGLSAASVAFATSFAAWINCYLLICDKTINWQFLFKSLGSSLTASLIGSLCVLALEFFYFQDNQLINVLTNQTAQFAFSFSDQIERFGIQLLAFSTSFCTIFFLMQNSFNKLHQSSLFR